MIISFFFLQGFLLLVIDRALPAVLAYIRRENRLQGLRDYLVKKGGTCELTGHQTLKIVLDSPIEESGFRLVVEDRMLATALYRGILDWLFIRVGDKYFKIRSAEGINRDDVVKDDRISEELDAIFHEVIKNYRLRFLLYNSRCKLIFDGKTVVLKFRMGLGWDQFFHVENMRGLVEEVTNLARNFSSLKE